MALEPIDLKTTDNTIPSDLRADIMRESMENKNLLSSKGSIYVGTGEYTAKKCTVDSVEKEAHIYKTGSLPLGKDGQILTSKNGNLAYDYISAANFPDPSTEVNLSDKNIILSGSQLNDGSVDNVQMAAGSYPNVHKIQHVTSGISGITPKSLSGATSSASTTIGTTAEISADLPQGTLTLSEGISDGYLSMFFNKKDVIEINRTSSTSGTFDEGQTNQMWGHTYAVFFLRPMTEGSISFYEQKFLGMVYFDENFVPDTNKCRAYLGVVTGTATVTYVLSLTWEKGDGTQTIDYSFYSATGYNSGYCRFVPMD